ncbi:MAG: DHH family phosphoesterase, partial [Elusimicrobia bacterium]|nr:DHH family phosphoesterase [Elusimicrobiota bacterium]
MKLYRKKTIELLPKEGRILIFHHWDTDGISSGALVADFIQSIGDYQIDFVYPDVGTFEISLGKNVKIPSEKYAAGFLLDYSVPPEDILLLQNRLEAPLIVFDHHLKLAPDKDEVLYINPVARGEHGTSWPATTLVVTEGLGLNPSNYTLLGIARDYGHKLLKSYIDSFPKIKC